MQKISSFITKYTTVNKSIIPNTWSYMNLVNKNTYFINRQSKGKRLRKKIKYFESRPEIFKKISRIKPQDLTAQDITFPINIPIKLRYVYRPSKSVPKIPLHDFVNFKRMSGNEILLNLENPNLLRPSELCSALIEISKHEGSESINWNDHEWIQNVVQYLIKNIAQFKHDVIPYYIVAFEKLKISDEQLWSALERECDKCLHKFNAKAFGYSFLAFHKSKERATPEFLQKLVDRLPIHLHKMSPTLMTECILMVVENGFLNEHLWDNHVNYLFWRRNKWFGHRNYPRMVRMYTDQGHIDDLEFWNKDIIPQIQQMKDKWTEQSAQDMMDSLNYLQEKQNKLNLSNEILFLEKQKEYCQTRQKAIENSRFFNVVLNDIGKYQQEQKTKLQQQSVEQ